MTSKEKKNIMIEKTNFKLKNLIRQAKAKGMIKSQEEAFEKFPVCEEYHKGKKEYFN